MASAKHAKRKECVICARTKAEVKRRFGREYTLDNYTFSGEEPPGDDRAMTELLCGRCREAALTFAEVVADVINPSRPTVTPKMVREMMAEQWRWYGPVGALAAMFIGTDINRALKEKMPKEERDKLDALVTRVHMQDKQGQAH